jgi:hypothetical protein
MKKLIGALILVVSSFAMVGCDAFHRLAGDGHNSQGAPYEVVVVCKNSVWESSAGDTLRYILQQPVPTNNQYEPLFDVLRVAPDNFKNLLERHRNVLKLLVDPTVENTGIGVQYDVTSKPQIVILAQAPTEEDMSTLLAENAENLVQVLEAAERDRTIDLGKRYGAKELEDAIREKFGVTMHIPKGYLLRSSAEDFLWASYEYPTASQGFFVYSYPYKGKESLSLKSLLAARNKFAAKIPGPSDGSYMTTLGEYEPDYRMMRIEGRLWVEMRGLWDVANDFMGGPFVSFSTVDTATNRVFTIDCYVYSPKLGKRNFLRQLEHLVYMTQFPTPAAE